MIPSDATKSKSPIISELEFDALSKVRLIVCNLWQGTIGTCVIH